MKLLGDLDFPRSEIIPNRDDLITTKSGIRESIRESAPTNQEGFSQTFIKTQALK
jgi:hypothetical protein